MGHGCKEINGDMSKMGRFWEKTRDCEEQTSVLREVKR